MDSNYENVFLIQMVRWCRRARELVLEGCAWKNWQLQKFECTWPCHLVIELALEANCQLRRHVLTLTIPTALYGGSD